MKEYIDREKLIKELECGIRAGNYEDGYENYTHINDVDDCVDTVKYFDKADVVEKKKIDKAIEEIQKLRGCSCSCSDGIIDDVEDILDKLIESEKSE